MSPAPITAEKGRHALPESLLYPFTFRAQLIHAAGLPQELARVAAIDRITDELARLGYCWPRVTDLGEVRRGKPMGMAQYLDSLDGK